MRAMILAAGRGERMGSLTANTPKPLLKIGEHYLIEYMLYALKKANISEIVINVCYCADQIKKVLGSGQAYGVNIQYSEEESPLETGGGILKALPLLGSEAFVVVSADIIANYNFENLPKNPIGLAHLVMVDNPTFHPEGDFCLSGHVIHYDCPQKLTFGNIGIYRPELFTDITPGRFKLSDLFIKEIPNKQITGEYFDGFWHNVGTPADVRLVEESLTKTQY